MDLAILIPVAFLAGIVTAISPCVLPVLPVALAGAATGGRRRPLGIVVGFVITLVVFTLALTAAFDAIGLSASAQRNVGVVVLLGFALTMIVPALGDRLTRVLTPLQRLGSRLPTGRDGFGGGVVMGLGLGLVWAPCAGPVFSAIAAATATEKIGASTWLVLFVYAIGAALPMLAIMRGGQRLAKRLAPRAVPIRVGMGVLLAATGVLIFTGLDTRLTAWAVNSVPGYTNTLQAAERSAAASDGLAKVQGREQNTNPITTVAQKPKSPQAEKPKPAAAPTIAPKVDLPVYAAAPDFAGLTEWFNADGIPRTLKQLRGKVVLIDFWTYSCINCIRTIPHLREWDTRYRDEGLVIVGVHTPEFAFEREPDNVRKAITNLGVTWPVALDPDYGTWNAWGNQYWPAKYLIDQEGNVRAYHFGEGAYDETEKNIRLLLAETGATAKQVAETGPRAHSPITPETYLGHSRIDRFDSTPPIARDKPVRYDSPDALAIDHVAFQGEGLVTTERVTAGADFSIDLRFRAKRVFLVLGGNGKPLPAEVLLDGQPIAAANAGTDVNADGRLTVREHRLYDVVKLPKESDHRLLIRLAPGTSGYAFTFG